MSERRLVQLSELADVSGGYAFKSKDYVPNGHFILRTLNISDQGRIDKSNAVFLPEQDVPKYPKFSLREFDTIFVMVGATLGKTGIITSTDLPALLNQNMWRIRAKRNKCDPRFLYYCFLANKNKIEGFASGSARSFLRRDDCREMLVEAPSFADQKAIAHILGTLDDKIELNQKMNQILEDIAKAIFKSWFVDFDPVRAKAEGRPTGLSHEISDLFPGEFVESELGEIPKGWLIDYGNNLYKHQKGLSYKGKFLSDDVDDIPMLNLGSFLGNGKYRKEKLKFYRGEYKDHHQIYEGELLLANTDLTQDRIIIGSPILVPSSPNKSKFYLHTHHTTKIIPNLNRGISSTFLYFNFLQDSFRKRVSGFATGTTVLAISSDTFDLLEVIVPPESIRLKFENLVGPIIEKSSILSRENDVLSELRDTLLPKLISGELRIPDAEKFLEGTTI